MAIDLKWHDGFMAFKERAKDRTPMWKQIPNYLNDRNATWRVLEGMDQVELIDVCDFILPRDSNLSPVNMWVTILMVDLPTIIRAILEVKGKRKS